MRKKLKITNYRQSMEERVITLWNKCLIEDIISPEIFRKQILFDENFQENLCFVAIEDKSIVGFLLATKRLFPYLERGTEPTRGWINLMFVDENYRRRGVGTQLVKEAEDALRDLGTERITLGAYSPSYIFPGIDIENYHGALAFFEKLGYIKTGEAESMTGNLINYKLPNDFSSKLEVARNLGYNFKKFSYEYSFKLLNFLKDEFGGGWKRNALTHMQSNQAEDTIWICTDLDDNVVGFCMRKMDGNDSRFGPFGVKASLRSHGIGSILFSLMMEDMKKKRIYNLFFLWTHGKAKEFYLRHGIKVYRSYYLYDKTYNKL